MMKKNQTDFLNKLDALCKEYDIHSIQLNGNTVEFEFDDYYDIIRFERYESGRFMNVSAWSDYVVPEGAEK
jgi:hypothetical protein